MNEQKLWEECVTFHGHSCGGLVSGFKAALYALELMGVDKAEDEELVCVAENDACGIDAIQYITGCTMGKGNLLFRLRGKQAFSFYNRKTGQSFRIILKERDKKKESLLELKNEDIFTKMEAGFQLPKKAEIFISKDCQMCGERTAEPYLRVQREKEICLSCYIRDERHECC